QHGKNVPTEQLMSYARTHAESQIELQKADFMRLGVLGDWDNPYKTMNFGTEAAEIRVLGRLFDRGYVYRGLKPVNWCFDCQSALRSGSGIRRQDVDHYRCRFHCCRFRT